MIVRHLYFILTVIVFGSCAQNNEKAKEVLSKSDVETLYIGTYTKKEGHVDGKADGIYKLQMNKATGELTVVDTVPNTVNPSYLAIHPNKKYLYAVNEIADGNQIGTVTAYNIETDEIKEIQKISSYGDAPCHISIDRTGKFLTVANYMEYMSLYEIKSDGSLAKKNVLRFQFPKSEHPRQETGHPHMVYHAFDSNSIFIADLGLDHVCHFRITENGEFTRHKDIRTTPQAGPRHLAIHPNQPWMYILNELNATIEAFYYHGADEKKENFQIINTIESNKENVAPSAIKIHPNGKFLYSANRAINEETINSISVFSINAENGKLELLQSQDSKGLVPRDFSISPDGKFLLAANQNSNTIVTFKINQETGKLEETGHILEISTPVCLKFL